MFRLRARSAHRRHTPPPPARPRLANAARMQRTPGRTGRGATVARTAGSRRVNRPARPSARRRRLAPHRRRGAHKREEGPGRGTARELRPRTPRRPFPAARRHATRDARRRDFARRRLAPPPPARSARLERREDATDARTHGPRGDGCTHGGFAEGQPPPLARPRPGRLLALHTADAARTSARTGGARHAAGVAPPDSATPLPGCEAARDTGSSPAGLRARSAHRRHAPREGRKGRGARAARVYASAV